MLVMLFMTQGLKPIACRFLDIELDGEHRGFEFVILQFSWLVVLEFAISCKVVTGL